MNFKIKKIDGSQRGASSSSGDPTARLAASAPRKLAVRVTVSRLQHSSDQADGPGNQSFYDNALSPACVRAEAITPGQ